MRRMQLFLMRHGSATRQGAYADADRPLTETGESQARTAGHVLARLGSAPPTIWASPAIRCRRTAEIVAEQLGLDAGTVRVTDELAGGATPQRLLERVIHAAAERVLMVGHQPDLEKLASFMVGGDRGLSLHLEPGGCMCLECATRESPALLRWLLTPKLLRCIASAAHEG